eukprot:TRINITY_DN4947_c0_g1_i1.p1 TRINITY_DN4947_c0_g1~~TRINITY_DN4947_c0_g1_i1.p1  ORF type:complete len:573 (+),score=138.37 TRINITY_DN4947_c0_g1_i1:260-1978(+)
MRSVLELTKGLNDLYKRIERQRGNAFERNGSFNSNQKYVESGPCFNRGLSGKMKEIFREIEEGRTFFFQDRYQLIRIVASGNFSHLIMAKDTFKPLNEKKELERGKGEYQMVAIKIMRQGFHSIGEQEANRLWNLNVRDCFDSHSIVRIFDHFYFDAKNHFCIVLEFLQSTLQQEVKKIYSKSNNSAPQLYYQDFIAQKLAYHNHVSSNNTNSLANSSQILNLRKIASIASQLFRCLHFLNKYNIIHGDMKSENLLFIQPLRSYVLKVDEEEAAFYESKSNSNSSQVIKKSYSSVALKVADFGNSFTRDKADIYYKDFEVQSLLYRAPEVLFGLPFGVEIDTWSVGCILMEIFTGGFCLMGNNLYNSIIFHKNSPENAHLQVREEPLLSPKEAAKNMQVLLGSPPVDMYSKGIFFKERFISVEKSKSTLSDILDLSKDHCFADFITRTLEYDPSKRIKPREALSHPFLTKFGCSKSIEEECPLQLYESKLGDYINEFGGTRFASKDKQEEEVEIVDEDFTVENPNKRKIEPIKTHQPSIQTNEEDIEINIFDDDDETLDETGDLRRSKQLKS